MSLIFIDGFEKFPTTKCPTCGYVFNCTSNVFNITTMPRANDFAICFSCGEWMRFTEDLELRLLVEEDLKALSREQIAVMKERSKQVIAHRNVT